MWDVCFNVGPEELCWPIEVFIISIVLEILFYGFVLLFGARIITALRRRFGKPTKPKEMNHFPPSITHRGDDYGRQRK